MEKFRLRAIYGLMSDIVLQSLSSISRIPSALYRFTGHAHTAPLGKTEKRKNAALSDRAD